MKASPGQLRSFTLAALLAAALLSAPSLMAAPDAGRDFTLKVLPLLREKCFAGHGDDAKKIKGELNLLTREGMLKGGENSQEVLVPGKAEESDLSISVTWQNEDLEMPPKENDRLKPEQVELVKAWINAGAPLKASATSATCTLRCCTFSAWTTTSSPASTPAVTSNSASPAAR